MQGITALIAEKEAIQRTANNARSYCAYHFTLTAQLLTLDRLLFLVCCASREEAYTNEL